MFHKIHLKAVDRIWNECLGVRTVVLQSTVLAAVSSGPTLRPMRNPLLTSEDNGPTDPQTQRRSCHPCPMLSKNAKDAQLGARKTCVLLNCIDPANLTKYKQAVDIRRVGRNPKGNRQ